jgi:aminocarboxymuconate-semialdehyde decarboxylase
MADDTDMDMVLATAQELDVPLILHPYYVEPRPGLEDFNQTNLVGNPLKSTISAARSVLGGVLDELTELSLVLMHGGRFLPYQIGRLDHRYRVRPEAKGCRQAPSSYLRRVFYVKVAHAAQPLRFLAEMDGSRSVLFGYPYDRTAGPLADQLRGVCLDDESVDDIAEGSTTRLVEVGAPGTSGPVTAGGTAEK